MMQVTLVERWHGYPIGQVMNLPDGMANILIKRGFAHEVVEVADVSIKAETASISHVRTKHRAQVSRNT